MINTMDRVGERGSTHSTLSNLGRDSSSPAFSPKRRARAFQLRAYRLRVLLGVAVLGGSACFPGCAQQLSTAPALPDAPSALLARADVSGDSRTKPETTAPQITAPPRNAIPPPCPSRSRHLPPGTPPSPPPLSCVQKNQLQPIVVSGRTVPLTPSGKAELAARDVVDPFNLITIAGYSAIATAANAHSAYGPGFRGFGRLTGYSLVEDVQGEFFETFLIPTLAHEDPRYHRMPDAPLRRRVLHAIGHTFVSHHDDGRPMPNYATLLTYPISAELSNLYVPGVSTDGPSTARRIGIGIATDPAGALIAEFLPDIAKHIHVHIIFVQEILNRVVVGPPDMH